jgi:hypothetical protein
MSSMFLVVYTSAHLIGAVSLPLTAKQCEVARENWVSMQQVSMETKAEHQLDFTYACERHKVRPKVQFDIPERAVFESDCWNLLGGLKNCRQLPNGDIENHSIRNMDGSMKFYVIKFKDRAKL